MKHKMKRKVQSPFIICLTFVFLSFSAWAESTKYARIINFGDSLSDIGTYAQTAALLGGGKFTTNPGPLWIELIAKKLNLPMKVNRQEGFGASLKIVGGLNYAQGGSRIITPGSFSQGATERPLKEQIDYFQAEHAKFNSDDLVFIQGGANDLFGQMYKVISGSITPDQAMQKIIENAVNLSDLVVRLRQMGDAHIVVLNLPVMEKTPRVIALDFQIQTLVQQMVLIFNQTLSLRLVLQNVEVIDFYGFDYKFNEDYDTYGFKNISGVACKSKGMLKGSSLFCNSKSLVEAKADQTFKFADDVHPTAGFSRIAADFIYEKMAK